MILAGIAITALFGAATTSLMVAFSDRVQSAVFWLAGGLTSEGWSSLEVVWPYFAAGFVLAVVPRCGRSTGSRSATTWPRRWAAARGSCACRGGGGGAAASAGRARRPARLPRARDPAPRAAGRRDLDRTASSSRRRALTGAALLLAGDTLARVVFAPIELPVGPLMVLLGVPLFLWLLRKAV